MENVQFVVEKAFHWKGCDTSTFGAAQVRVVNGRLAGTQRRFVCDQWPVHAFQYVVPGLSFTAKRVNEEVVHDGKPQHRVSGLRCVDKDFSPLVNILLVELDKKYANHVSRLAQTFGARLSSALYNFDTFGIDHPPSSQQKTMENYGFRTKADKAIVDAAIDVFKKHKGLFQLLHQFPCIPAAFAVSMRNVSPDYYMKNPWLLVQNVSRKRTQALQVADQMNNEGPKLSMDNWQRVAAFVDVAVHNLSNEMHRFVNRSADDKQKHRGVWNPYQGSLWFARDVISAELRGLASCLVLDNFANETYAQMFTPGAGLFEYDDAIELYARVDTVDMERKLATALIDRAHALRGGRQAQKIVLLWDRMMCAEADEALLLAEQMSTEFFRGRGGWKPLFDAYTELDDTQRKALSALVHYGLVLLTGNAGTGKSKTLVFLLRFLQEIAQERPIATAISGKAVERLRKENCNGGIEFRTVASLLHNPPTEPRALVIDEASMISPRDMLQLLPHANEYVIIAGDDKQLPSIGAGAFLRDVTNARVLQHTHLTTVHRSCSHGRELATQLHKYISNNVNSDEVIVNRTTGACQQHLVNGVKKDECIDGVLRTMARLSADSANEEHPQLIAATKHTCTLYNIKLQKMFNSQNATKPGMHIQRSSSKPDVDSKASQRGEKTPYRSPIVAIDDPVLTQTPIYRPNKDVIVNGLMGIVTEVDTEKHEFTVRFANGMQHVFTKGSNEIELAYCVTAHKFQGSETKNVVVVLMERFGQSVEMLYTSMSRAQKEAHLFITREGFKNALETSVCQRRATNLQAYLKRCAADGKEPPVKKQATAASSAAAASSSTSSSSVSLASAY